MGKLSLRAVQKLTCKKRDAWWTVLLVDPVATRMLIGMAKFRFITPNRVTWSALFVGLGSAYFFLKGDTPSLVIGAALYHLSFILDCIDGKLARLKGNGTVFGGWLDYVFDRIRVLFCALALMGGQYLRTHNELYLLAALAVVFLDMLRYVDALQIYKMRMSMRMKIEKVTLERKALEDEQARREAAETADQPKVVFIEDLLRENPGVEAEVLKQQAGEVVDLHAQFRNRFPWYTRFRQALLRSRIRPHLISGIEFQMFIFIVAPLIGQILWTTAISAAALGLFELVIMYKFWLSTRDFTRLMDELATEPSQAGVIAEHLHRGRHRRGGDAADEQAQALTEKFPLPEQDDDLGFQPYPRPYTPHPSDIETQQLRALPYWAESEGSVR
ncbi:CDP-alcohol phosphatidyltransferase family protein [Streptomyces drozdowiczii]|uniref:CDP-alcohol phosphatidyltransferase family protein n=1 Tax=Streptomyces drozdowiczii TaxID=202862 RepID=A0ABY6PNE0_9ACTN|nr:CDP-alcohol phosphatidyltransferase family protein [Streptomyces drozdowiczii]MCX0246810.1 CDP-alcohol phosphatidyltransferase family protein [Streptomyces drozdowiczii]UZK53733.1 CDP-alcohol phosphatidyltransferase family protein [Streptomyces drozdowiczii]